MRGVEHIFSFLLRLHADPTSALSFAAARGAKAKPKPNQSQAKFWFRTFLEGTHYPVMIDQNYIEVGMDQNYIEVMMDQSYIEITLKMDQIYIATHQTPLWYWPRSS